MGIIDTLPQWAQITFYLILFFGSYFATFMFGAEWSKKFWKNLLLEERKRAKPERGKNLKPLYEQSPVVCGIDDRADDCDEEICDRLMYPHTKKHLEPAEYKYNTQP